MENKSPTNLVFANLQELLAGMPERDRHDFLKFLNKYEIIGNQSLEPIFLFQYNAGLFAKVMLGQAAETVAATDLSLSQQKAMLEMFRAEIQNEIRTAINLAIKDLRGTTEDSTEKMREVLQECTNKFLLTLINTTENVSSFWDTTRGKVKDFIDEKELEKINIINTYTEAAEKRLEGKMKEFEAKLDLLVLELGKKAIPDALKESVKTPVAAYLKKYLEMAKQEKSPWGAVGLIRDFVLYGGTLILFKFLHFI